MQQIQVNHGVPLKSGLRAIQDHWKWHPSLDRIRFPIGVPVTWAYFVFLRKARYWSIINHDFFIPRSGVPVGSNISYAKARAVGLAEGRRDKPVWCGHGADVGAEEASRRHRRRNTSWRHRRRHRRTHPHHQLTWPAAARDRRPQPTPLHSTSHHRIYQQQNNT